MKIVSFVIFILLTSFIHSTALAVPPGKIIEYTKNPIGKVTFSGKIHADKGLKCNACHPILFSLKKGTAEIKLVDHEKAKKYCFSCHNGSKSFAAKDNCNKCHIKEK